MKRRRDLLTLLLVASALLAAGVLAQTGGAFDLSWWTVDGQATVSSGGAYTLGSISGQPEAGEASGGDYTLVGGFWGTQANLSANGRAYIPLIANDPTPTVVPTPINVPGCDDPEPDNNNNNRGALLPATGITCRGSLVGDATGDDYYRIIVAAGRTITLQLLDFPRNGPAYVLTLYRKDGNTLTQVGRLSNPTADEQIQVTNTAGSAVEYRIRVQNNPGLPPGNTYVLRVVVP